MRTKTATLQSRMNIDYCKYNMARKYIESLPYDQWVFIKDLPEAISYEIIDLIDGHKAAYKTAFCETFEKFLITRCQKVIATFNLNRYYNDSFNPGIEDKIKSRFKGVTWDKDHNFFRSFVWINNKNHFIGLYKNEHIAKVSSEIASLNLKRYYGS